MSALQELEARIAGLRANIARRQAQTGESPHVAAARKELFDVLLEFIAMKCTLPVRQGGGWDPAELIERMAMTRIPIAPTSAPEAPAPTIIKSDETRDRLAALLDQSPDKFFPRSTLKELIS